MVAGLVEAVVLAVVEPGVGPAVGAGVGCADAGAALGRSVPWHWGYEIEGFEFRAKMWDFRFADEIMQGWQPSVRRWDGDGRD